MHDKFIQSVIFRRKIPKCYVSKQEQNDFIFFFLQLETRGWEDSLASLGIPAAFPQHFGAQWSPRKFADNEPSGKRFRGPAQWKHAFYKPNATLNAPLNVVEWQVLVSPRKTHWINTFRESTLREDRLASTRIWSHNGVTLSTSISVDFREPRTRQIIIMSTISRKISKNFWNFAEF